MLVRLVGIHKLTRRTHHTPRKSLDPNEIWFKILCVTKGDALSHTHTHTTEMDTKRMQEFNQMHVQRVGDGTLKWCDIVTNYVQWVRTDVREWLHCLNLIRATGSDWKLSTTSSSLFLICVQYSRSPSRPLDWLTFRSHRPVRQSIPCNTSNFFRTFFPSPAAEMLLSQHSFLEHILLFFLFSFFPVPFGFTLALL